MRSERAPLQQNHSQWQLPATQCAEQLKHPQAAAATVKLTVHLNTSAGFLCSLQPTGKMPGRRSTSCMPQKDAQLDLDIMQNKCGQSQREQTPCA